MSPIPAARPAADDPAPGADAPRGAGIGLPPTGSGSVAGIGRRLGTYAIDWSLCAGLSLALRDGSAALVWPVFTAMNVVLISLFGATPGQLLLGVHVIPVAGRMPMVVRAIGRTVLLLLLIPTLVWNRDGQALQDVATGTAVVRR